MYKRILDKERRKNYGEVLCVRSTWTDELNESLSEVAQEMKDYKSVKASNKALQGEDEKRQNKCSELLENQKQLQ